MTGCIDEFTFAANASSPHKLNTCPIVWVTQSWQWKLSHSLCAKLLLFHSVQTIMGWSTCTWSFISQCSIIHTGSTSNCLLRNTHKSQLVSSNMSATGYANWQLINTCKYTYKPPKTNPLQVSRYAISSAPCRTAAKGERLLGINSPFPAHQPSL